MKANKREKVVLVSHNIRRLALTMPDTCIEERNEFYDECESVIDRVLLDETPDPLMKREVLDTDMIDFSLWIGKMGYEHRLKYLPSQLMDYYLENRESIVKENNVWG